MFEWIMAGGSTPSRRPGHGTAGFAGARQTRYAQHVWVGSMPAPGVLVEWRKQGAFWQAQVAYVDAGRLVVAWLPAEMVRPLSAT